MVEEEEIVIKITPPPRCSYYRGATWWEIIKYLVLGPVRGFDPEQERRCRGYAGHSRFGYPHQTVNGKCWWQE